VTLDISSRQILKVVLSVCIFHLLDDILKVTKLLFLKGNMPSTDKYLDDETVFVQGPYEGERLEDVMDADPDYIEFLIEEDFLDASEHEAILTLSN